MRESVPTNEPEAHKRRSTRIVQAVPLTITGIDALGRPFQERTSTLIINCHGCRYQSKHYVLKNMWVTLEVPHQEPGHPARTVRGRVMWIQRPRTVRELFQVGVELEVTGNFWGIAFPPSDWFPFPEGLAAVPSPALPEKPPAPPSETPWPVPSPAGAVTEHNVRTLPLVPSVEPSPSAESLAPAQIARLIEEAKQDLQAALRQSAAEAVSLEARPLIASLELQLKSMAEKSLELAAASAAEKAFQQAKQVQVDAFLKECNRSITESAGRAAQQLATRLDELEKERGAAFEQRVGKKIEESLQGLQNQAANLRPQIAENSRAESQLAAAQIPSIHELEERVRAQVEEARASVSEIVGASRHLHDQAASSFSNAQSEWRAQVEADLAGAAQRWHEQIESSIESARQQLVDRLANQAQSAGEQVEKDLALRIGDISKAFLDAAHDWEARLNGLRASLDQDHERAQESMRKLQSAENQIEDHAAKLQVIAGAAEKALEQRASALLEVQSQEMARRAEDGISTWAQRLQPALEAAGEQTVTRLAAQLKGELSDRVQSGAAMVARLETTIESAENALRSRQEALAKASEQAIHSASERVKNVAGALAYEFQDSVRIATEKSVSEIEAKATDTTHHAFESLFKTAEWYEKKVHTQMQAAIDKGMENALATLKEKAREMSGVFGAELDHYSRSYVEHTQGQVDEATRESLEKLRKHAEEMAAASAGSIVQQAREDSEAALEGFNAKAAGLSAEIKAHFEAQAAEARAKSESDSQQFAAEFRAALKLQVQDELGSARKELIGELREESKAQQQILAECVAGLNYDAIEDYKRRLEAASNSWLLTTVAKLSQQSEQQVQALSRAAEERLRAACTEVFSGVGDALRRGLADVNPGTLPPEKSGD